MNTRRNAKMNRLALLLVLILAGCGGGNNNGNRGNPAPPLPPPPPPPPPVMCEWDDTIPADDPACVEPPTNCELSIEWVNPTHDVNENELAPDALIAATATFFRIPEAPREAEFIHGLDAYILNFRFVGGEESIDIQYYVWLTVSNEHGESDPSNQVEKICEPI